MPYIVRIWIPVDIEDNQIFNTYEEAEKEIENLSLMQPENIYEIEEVK